jgi:serine phosphatase RsbU (regulator of sigma subunit)
MKWLDFLRWIGKQRGLPPTLRTGKKLQLSCEQLPDRSLPSAISPVIGPVMGVPTADATGAPIQNGPLFAAARYDPAALEERYRGELERAHQVQRTFLPSLPTLKGYQFFASYEPAYEVGGDYYDFIALASPERLAITLGDVAGKGVPASLLMAKFSADARHCLATEREPAAAFARLNDLLFPHTSQLCSFVTMAAGIINPADHTVTLVNAGHPTPLIYRAADGSVQEAMLSSCVGMPLGIVQGRAYNSVQVTLEPGDSLLLFTDGVQDAMSVVGAHFGVEGVQSALQSADSHSPAALGEQILKAVRRHSQGRTQFDDIAVVCVGRDA